MLDLFFFDENKFPDGKNLIKCWVLVKCCTWNAWMESESFQLKLFSMSSVYSDVEQKSHVFRAQNNDEIFVQWNEREQSQQQSCWHSLFVTLNIFTTLLYDTSNIYCHFVVRIFFHNKNFWEWWDAAHVLCLSK